MSNASRRYLLLLVFLAAFALLNIGGALLYQATRPNVGFDFHAYWYYGHYIRQGRDLYFSFLHNPEMLDLPVRYLDGVVVDHYPVHMSEGSMAPVWTAPMLFFFSLFSWFSWPVAESLWFVCNLAMMLATPFALMRLLPPEQRLRPQQQWVAALIVFGLFSTRFTLEAGQAGFFVLLLLVGAFALRDRAWPLAGLLLGLALSKYSLALPALVLLLLMRKFRVVLTALLVQLAGFVAISSLAGASPQLTLQAQWIMFLAHGAEEGVNLSARLLADNPLAVPALVALTALVLGLLGNWLWRSGWLRSRYATFSLETLQVFNVLTLLTLLVAYHRVYDVVLIAGFVVFMVYALTPSRATRPLGRARSVLLVYFVVLLVTLIGVANVSRELWARVWPEVAAQFWFDAMQGLVSLMLLYALLVSLWLLYRLNPQKQFASIRPEQHARILPQEAKHV